MSTKNESFSEAAILVWKFLGITLLGIIIMIPAFLLDGFVALRLYQWFVESTFRAAPRISLAEALGLSMLLGYLTRVFVYSPSGEKTWKQKLEPITFVYLSPFLTLLTGYLIHLFV
jgi:hypothetical protein